MSNQPVELIQLASSITACVAVYLIQHFFSSMIIYAGLVSSDNTITISYSEFLLSYVYMYLCTKHFNLISVFVKRMKQNPKK